MLHDKQYIPQEQYTEIRYEKLMQDPNIEMKRILDFCDLPWTQDFQSHVDAFHLESRNFKWSDRFTPCQVADVGEEPGEVLGKDVPVPKRRRIGWRRGEAVATVVHGQDPQRRTQALCQGRVDVGAEPGGVGDVGHGSIRAPLEQSEITVRTVKSPLLPHRCS